MDEVNIHVNLFFWSFNWLLIPNSYWFFASMSLSFLWSLQLPQLQLMQNWSFGRTHKCIIMAIWQVLLVTFVILKETFHIQKSAEANFMNTVFCVPNNEIMYFLAYSWRLPKLKCKSIITYIDIIIIFQWTYHLQHNWFQTKY